MRVSRDGFTLVEIMAALAILGLAMFILLQTHYGALRVFETSRKQMVHRELASRAFGIAETDLYLGNFSGSNDFGKRYPGYSYRYEAAPISEDMPYLYEIRVFIISPEGEQVYRQLAYYSGG